MAGKPDTPKAKTKDKLLNSAREIFAQKGFRDATIKEICEQADANIASVNYHFGSKEDLYSRAWQKAFEESLEKHPPHGGVPEEAPPEERLRGRIFSLIRRISDRESQEFLFAQKEMANPTPLGKQVFNECIEPLVEDTRELLSELLAPADTKQNVQYCERSIVSQCFHIMHLRKKQRMFSDTSSDNPFPSIDDVETYAEHVYRFSLAGIREISNSHTNQSTGDET